MPTALMNQSGRLARLPRLLFSLAVSPFKSFAASAEDPYPTHHLLRPTQSNEEEYLASDDEPRYGYSTPSIRKTCMSFWRRKSLARRYHNSTYVWAMALLGTLSLGSMTLYGTFVLFCLFNGFWPSIQWTRATTSPISAIDLAGVYPIACHSHNDYWRPQPLATALLNGCTSVEADVWLHDGKVVVGHTEAGISPNRTLSSLYIEPLLQLLNQQNEHSSTENQSSDTARGVFESNPLQTLTLLLDFKTDIPTLWDHIYHELNPLRTRGYLTHFNGTSVYTRAVTVVVSGSAPFAEVAAQGYFRDMFFDAPLQIFSSGKSEPQPLPNRTSSNETFTNGLELRAMNGVPTNAAVYSPTNSYYASGNFKHIVGHIWRSKLSDQQLGLIRAQIEGAHARGLKVRYWGVPSWPIGIRNYLWRVLVREGVDVLSVENVRAVAHDNWGPRKGGCRSDDLL